MTVIGLSGRRALEAIVARSKEVRQYRRAQALLWLDEGERAVAVAQRLRGIAIPSMPGLHGISSAGDSGCQLG